MEIAGITLASVSAAHELISCGIRIYRRIKDREKLTFVLREFQMFDLKDRQSQLTVDIELAQGVLKSATIDDEHKERLKQNWERIKDLMIRFDELIEEMIKNSSLMASRPRHKARNMLLDLGGTRAISTAIQEFQSVVLALRVLSKEESRLFTSPNDFQPLNIDKRVYGPSCQTFFGRGRLTDPRQGVPNTPQWFLFESKPYEHQIPEQKEALKHNIRILAQKLHQAQDDKGILRLVGFRDEPGHNGGNFQLIFTCPFEGRYPLDLGAYLKTGGATPSLNFRVSLCTKLATAVLQAQTLGLVHKNLRPENILLIPNSSTRGATSESTPGVFLIGWQYARQVDRGVTILRGETSLQRKIYQHPERQLLQAEREYTMAHDAYSLGVCMIEILTWKSLLIATQPPTMSQDFIEAFERLNLQKDTEDPYTRYPDQIKETLCCMCEELLPAVAGDKMARLIKDFLTCLDDASENDDSNVNQYGPPHDKDRRQVAVHFVDTALKALWDFQRAIY